MDGQRVLRRSSSGDQARGRPDASQRGSRRVRAGLLTAGLKWRAASSAAMFVVAVFGVVVAAFGPMYLHSADQSILSARLDTAADDASGLTLDADSPAAIAAVPRVVRAVPRPSGASSWFGRPLTTRLGVFTTEHRGPFRGNLVSRSGVCAHLHMVAGSCALGGSGVVLSDRSAVALGLVVGDRLAITFGAKPLASPSASPSPSQSASTPTGGQGQLVVRGLYAPSNPFAPYWWGENFFTFGRTTVPGTTGIARLDAVFASGSTVRTLTPSNDETLLEELAYRRGSLTVDQVPELASGLAGMDKLGARHKVLVSTQLDSLLSDASSTEHTTGTIVFVVDLQVVLLALFVLYFVASRTAVDREPDVRLAELRGYRPRGAIGVALAEPVVLVACAVPAGLLCAWLAALASADLVVGTATAVPVSLLTVVTAVATGAAGVVATAFATRRIFSAGIATVASLDVRSRRAATWRLVGDVAVVAVAAAAFFELVIAGVARSARSSSDPLAAFAPGLLALAVGVLGARIVPVVLRAGYGRTARSRRVALSLALRRVARRREFVAQIVLVTLAAGLATFAVSGWAVAGRNRGVRSAFDVGASKVLTVSTRPGVTLVPAVRKADGGGSSAMAAVLVKRSDGTTLAVDATRMASVMSWPAGMGASVTDLARRLGRSTRPALLRGSRVRVSIDVRHDASPHPDLWLNLFSYADGTPDTVSLGLLRPGTSTYGSALPRFCRSGCRLVSFSMTWLGETPRGGSAATHTVRLVVRSVDDLGAGARWRPARVHLHDVTRWSVGQGELSTGTGGLAAQLHLSTFGTPATLAPASPQALPVAVTPATASHASGHGGPLVVGLDGGSVPGHTVAEIPAVPGTGENAILAGLEPLREFLGFQAAVASTDQVWLSATAPTDIARRLRAQGVTVLSARTVAVAAREQEHTGVSLAYDMFLLSAIAAALLAVGATGLAMATGARRRRAELAGMQATGVDGGTLRRAVWGEQVLAFGSGVLLGAVAGLVGAAVALRSIPEFVDAGPGPPLQLGLPPVDVAVTIGVLVVALAVLTVGGARLVSRGAVPERIGDAEAGTASRHRGRGARRVPEVAAPAPVPASVPTPPAQMEPTVEAGRAGLTGRDAAPGGVAVKLAGVLHLYGQLGEEVVGLRGVDLDIGAGEMVALVGPSGMGKTTLVRLMAGLMTPSAGTIRVGESELAGMRPAERRRLRGVEVGYVAQGTGANVLPFATAVENVWFAQNGARSRGHRPPWDPLDLLGALGLAGVADERLATLPHGPQQLVAVAAGVSTGPRLLLADEPTAQLSEESADDVVHLFRRINEDFGTTVVIVTHDEEVASAFPRTVTIRDGRVGADALEGQQYAVVDGSGSVQLPPEALVRLPPSTRVRVVTTAVGVELRSPELERAEEEAELQALQQHERADGTNER